MSNKFKYISIVLLTIVMIIGIKFGKVDDEYFIDVQVNKYYSEIWDCIITSEELEGKDEIDKIQEKVLQGRALIESFEAYVKDDYTEEYKQDVVDWSLRLDAIQQFILDEVNESVNKATALKTQKDIDYARNSIPENLPDKFKNEINNTLNSIVVYEDLDDELYLKAEKVFDSIQKTSREKESEIDLAQANINYSRELLKELTAYIYDNGIEPYKKELFEWSTRLDKLQEIIVNRVNELIVIAEANKNKDEIEEIKNLISDMPEKFSKDLIDKLNKIEVVN